MEVKTVVLPLSKPAADLLYEAFEAQEMIKIATDQINKLQGRIDSIREELLTHGVREGGNYELLEKQRVVRKVNVKRFAERFPEVYTSLMEQEIQRAKQNAGKMIALKDAERWLGKDDIDPVCDLQTTISFVVVQKELA